MGAIGFKLIVFIVSAVVVIVASLLMTTRAQVMVYAGAIMMLILFVIMMVNLDKGYQQEKSDMGYSLGKKAAGALIMTILAVELLFVAVFYQITAKPGSYPAEAVTSIGNTKTVGSLLYGQYLFPFEIASILLLVGIVGAVVLSKKKQATKK